MSASVPTISSIRYQAQLLELPSSAVRQASPTPILQFPTISPPFNILTSHFQTARTDAETIMSMTPVPQNLFLTEGKTPLEARLLTVGKEIHDAAKDAYTRIAQMILLIKNPQSTLLGISEIAIQEAKTVVFKAIDSIGPTHGGVVARLSITMIGIIHRSINDATLSDDISGPALKAIQSYLKILMSEFPPKGKEIMMTFTDVYEDTLSNVSKSDAMKASEKFEMIKILWEDPLYFSGDLTHIMKLNEHLQTAAALLGVKEVSESPRNPHHITPHICLLNEALTQLKLAVGASDTEAPPAHIRGIEGNSQIITSAVAVLKSHGQPAISETDRIRSLAGTEIWELTANFRTAFLSGLIVASGGPTKIKRPAPVYSRPCHRRNMPQRRGS